MILPRLLFVVLVSPCCLCFLLPLRWKPSQQGLHLIASHSEVEEETARFREIARVNLQNYFRFPLDDWQLHAGGAIWDGYNVVVSAPTGAGKTVVAEMALHMAFNYRKQKSSYTTPLKALSNQKYMELAQIFGRQNTGLSTGDVSINKGASVTVMTTEVYRNIAWRGASELTDNAVVVLDEFHYMGNPGRGGVWEEIIITSPAHIQIVCLSATLANAKALASWIESVTNRRTVLVEVPASKRPVPLRYLYATKDGLFTLFRDPNAGPGAPNGLLGYRGDGEKPLAEQQKEKGKYGFGKASEEYSSSPKIPRGLQVNPELVNAAARRVQKVDRAIERQKARIQTESSFDDEYSPRRQMYQAARKMSMREERKERERLLKRELRKAVPSLHAVTVRLGQKKLLPAIFFLFSRAGCDEAARTLFRFMQGPRDPSLLLQDEIDEFRDKPPTEFEKRKRKGRQRSSRRRQLLQDSDGRSFRPDGSYVTEEALLKSLYEDTGQILSEEDFDDRSPLSSDNWQFYSRAGLLSYNEVQEVASKISTFNRENEEIVFDDEIAEQYMFGVGSHHAGLLPAHKSFVEVLFQKQLMKVVFATETLAAGINMPARTTVICALAKRGNMGSMNLLETSDLLQMAGRAGRRGFDTEGTCVIVATPFESHDDAAKILIDPIKPISSQFSPSYSLCVNLVARGGGKLDVAKQLVSKSFAMWEKRQAEESAAEMASQREGLAEVLLVSAQEKFMIELVAILQSYVDRRSAKFDIARLHALLEGLNDKEILKKNSKSFLGAIKMLELEKTTLSYLEQEMDRLRDCALLEKENVMMKDFLGEDELDLMEQIETQRKRAADTEREVLKHPFSAIAAIANTIMTDDSPESSRLLAALNAARTGKEAGGRTILLAEELSEFSKAAVVIRRKTRKLAKANPDLKSDTLLLTTERDKMENGDSWNDFLSITKTLVAYGCLTPSTAFHSDMDIENETFELTSAGKNVAMLGFENSLWSLVAMGGAWDVVGSSSRLDDTRKYIQTLDGESSEWYDVTEMTQDPEIPQPQREALDLVSLLRTMSPSEIAGYVSGLVAEGSRPNGPTLVELFQRISPLQQRVLQKSLLSLERLMEVQKIFSVDENARNCNL